MKPHKTTYLVETYPRIVDMSIFGSSVEKTQWEKLKKIIIKISGRGDIPDFSTFRGGVPLWVEGAQPAEGTRLGKDRDRAKSVVLLPIIKD